MPKPAAVPGAGLSRLLLGIMTFTTAAAVANLWYNQPLLGLMSAGLRAPLPALGLVPTLTQLGYAAGLLLFVPLGDRLPRRPLVAALLLATSLALAALGGAPTLGWAEAASAAVGAFTVAPQLIVPLAADLAPDARRGQVVGTVMGGLLLGVLAARTVSGFVGHAWGWRAMYGLAAAVSLLLAGLVALTFPHEPPRHREGGYLPMLASLWPLTREEPELVAAALAGAGLFASFSAFWTALTFLLEGAPYHYNPGTIGLFGLLGIGGASIAPLAGRWADRGDPRRTVGRSLTLAALAWLDLALGGHRLAWLILGTVVLDLATQSGHISNQSRIYALRPDARSRLNTVYMVAYFLGGSLGSGAASAAWATAGWTGVSITGVG
ncbi:MAG: MFS transporter, partial [Firmicutes bacterium]|nr:MFS transporter [Bacillota bacterium]